MNELGSAILKTARESLGEAWEELDDEHKKEAQIAVEDLAQLVVRQLAGEDVADEIGWAQARVANWTFVGSSRVARAIRAAALDAAFMVGAMFKGAVIG